MPDAPRGRLVALVAALVLLAVGGVAVWAYQLSAEAQRMEQRARDLSFAEEDRLWYEAKLAGDRAERRAALAALPARLADALLGDPLPPAAAETRAAELGARVVGAWRGGSRTVEYRADGTFRDAVAGEREWVGTWVVARLTGTRVLHLTRAGGGPGVVRLSFEGDELIHDDEPGRATVLRRR